MISLFIHVLMYHKLRLIYIRSFIIKPGFYLKKFALKFKNTCIAANFNFFLYIRFKIKPIFGAHINERS